MMDSKIVWLMIIFSTSAITGKAIDPRETDKKLIFTDLLSHLGFQRRVFAKSALVNIDPTLYKKETYEDHENECFSEHKFSYNGTCYEIAKQGPCASDELFILDDSPNASKLLRPICKKKRCTEKNQIWWKETNKCEMLQEIKATSCREKNTKVAIDPYGNGVCKCNDGTGKIKGKEDCLEFYKQGSCKNDEVVTYDKTTGSAICSIDKCITKNNIRNRRSLLPESYHTETTKSDRNKKRNKRAITPIKMFAPMGGNGECYRLGSAEPCGENDKQLRFVVDHLTFIPRCTNRKLQLSIVGGSSFCRTDDKQTCEKDINVKTEAREAFLKKFE